MKTLYSSIVTTTGGRTGHAVSSDALLDLHLAFPKSVGGPGTGPNPEHLFAAAHSACFGTSLVAAAGRLKLAVNANAIRVTATVSAIETESGGYTLGVALDIDLPGVDRESGLRLIAEAKTICAFSNVTKGNVDVQYRLK